jgi:hypothetical protein
MLPEPGNPWSRPASLAGAQPCAPARLDWHSHAPARLDWHSHQRSGFFRPHFRFAGGPRRHVSNQHFGGENVRVSAG